MPTYMLIMRSTDEGLAASQQGDFEAIINAMGSFNESMIEAGVMVGGDGLSDPRGGFVIDFSTPDREVIDGPYGPTESLFNGYWRIRVADRDEAIVWARRCPMGPGQKLEVRRVTDETDFAEFADNEYIQKEAGWREHLERAEDE